MDTTPPAPPSAGSSVLTADEIAALPRQPLGDDVPGVEHAVLWRDATSMAGVITVAGGHQLGEHAHRTNSHHMWVLEGSATILDAAVGPGSYVHVPPGVTHDIDARDTDGATLFYMYLT